MGSGPKAGTLFPVDVPTHVNALLDFPGTATAAATFSFDSAVNRRMIEIIGSEGALSLPDPNTFEGPLLVRGPNDADWRELPVTGTTAGRGIGVLDLARSIRAGTPHRASGELAHHVLELMSAITESGERSEFRAISSSVTAPEPLPHGLGPARGHADLTLSPAWAAGTSSAQPTESHIPVSPRNPHGTTGHYYIE